MSKRINYHSKTFTLLIIMTFLVNTYRKPIFTGLKLHFLSYIPHIYKLNSLKTLINRAYNICSTWANFHIKLSIQNIILLWMGIHTTHVTVLNNFLCQILSHKPADSEDIRYIKLQYMGCLGFEIRNSLNKIFKHCYSPGSFRFVYHNSNSFGF